MRRAGRAARPGGFTMVEVLVAAGVVALLAGLVLPSLAGARGAGRRAVCGSNARQLQLANDLYAGDARDRYAPADADALMNLDRWHGSRAAVGRPFTAGGGALASYLDGAGGDGAGTVRSCPEFAATLRTLAERGEGFERGCGGYGYNAAFVGSTRTRAAGPGPGPLWVLATDRAGSARAAFASPAATLSFADAAFAGGAGTSPTGGMVEYSFAEPRFWPDVARSGPPASSSRPDPSVHFRHPAPRAGGAGAGGGGASAGATVVWLDGHVATVGFGLTASSGLYGAEPGALGIGWPAGADDNGLFDYD